MIITGLSPSMNHISRTIPIKYDDTSELIADSPTKGSWSGPGWSSRRSGDAGSDCDGRASLLHKAKGGAEDSCFLKEPEIGQQYTWEEALVWLKRAEQD